MSVTAGVSDTVIAVRDKLRGKIGQTKVKRYWPGKAPDWADDLDDDADIRTAAAASLDKAFPSLDHPPDAPRKDDPRLRRLARTTAVSRDEARADHRRIRQAEIVSTAAEEAEQEEEAAEDDDEDVDEKRRRMKERSRLREREEAEDLEEEEEENLEEEEEEGSSSEYESDSGDEEGLGGAAMAKPVFVVRSERETVAERERAAAREAAEAEAGRRRAEERRRETKLMVVEQIRRDEEARKSAAEQERQREAADVDTDDEANEAEEYEAWKGRELGRIKKDREDREAVFRAKEEVDKVRAMTEEERREWDRRNPKPPPSSSAAADGGRKRKWRFMQKYFHKGAFFQEGSDDVAATAATDQIYTRDFSAPTGDDRMDKTILPKVMQVKHFGRSGRTKWTHLVNEDTTDWNNPWTNNDSLRSKYNEKMAGMNRPIAKPKGSKKLKDWESR